MQKIADKFSNQEQDLDPESNPEYDEVNVVNNDHANVRG